MNTSPYVCTEDDVFRITHTEIELAKSLILDFGEEVSEKLGKILLSTTE